MARARLRGRDDGRAWSGTSASSWCHRRARRDRVMGAGRRQRSRTRSTAWPPTPPARDGPRARHPNGVIAIDHVVVFTPSLERTTAAFAEIGVDCRRVREADDGVRQGFFLVGDLLVEVVDGVGSGRTNPRASGGSRGRFRHRRGGRRPRRAARADQGRGPARPADRDGAVGGVRRAAAGADHAARLDVYAPSASVISAIAAASASLTGLSSLSCLAPAMRFATARTNRR